VAKALKSNTVRTLCVWPCIERYPKGQSSPQRATQCTGGWLHTDDALAVGEDAPAAQVHRAALRPHARAGAAGGRATPGVRAGKSEHLLPLSAAADGGSSLLRRTGWFYSLVRQSPFHSSRRCGNAGHSTASPPSRLWVPSSGQRQHTLAVLWEGRPPAPATQLLSLSLSLWLVVL
jgi:hypothetical protein